MIQVSNLNQFPEDCYIAYFTGKNYEESIKLAGDWSGRTGAIVSPFDLFNYTTTWDDSILETNNADFKGKGIVVRKKQPIS